MQSRLGPVTKLLLLLLFLGVSAIFLVRGISLAQRVEERELEDTTPKHLPIKIKIRKEKEKAFKDLRNERWLRDLEIEVKNTGDKPIYFLNFAVDIPEIITPSGNMYGFSLLYGRSDLVSVKAPLKPEDVPIKPGQTYLFIIPEHIIKGWEGYVRDVDKHRSQPRKVRLVFQHLTFGDGTGFGDSSGSPRPPRKNRSGLSRCVPPSNKDPMRYLKPIPGPWPASSNHADRCAPSAHRRLRRFSGIARTR